jgi:hypothetical protein
MKKIIFFPMVVFLTVSAFAGEEWDGNRQIAVTMNPNPMTIGLLLGGFGINAGFEFAPVKWASLKANIYYIGFDPLKFVGEPLVYEDEYGDGYDDGYEEEFFLPTGSNISLFRVNLEGRWYPSGNYVSGLFVNGGLQFHRLSASASFSLSDAEMGKGMMGVYIDTWGVCAGVGYKAIFGKNRVGFVFEPVLDYAWVLHSDIPFKDLGSGGSMLGWFLGAKGLRGTLMFGAAF